LLALSVSPCTVKLSGEGMGIAVCQKDRLRVPEAAPDRFEVRDRFPRLILASTGSRVRNENRTVPIVGAILMRTLSFPRGTTKVRPTALALTSAGMRCTNCGIDEPAVSSEGGACRALLRTLIAHRDGRNTLFRLIFLRLLARLRIPVKVISHSG
jgi:hypothetical protein